MATQVCSVEISKLSPASKARYAAVKTPKQKGVTLQDAQRASVATMLDEARVARGNLVAEVQRLYPGLLTDTGAFQEDVRAAEFAAARQAGQLDLADLDEVAIEANEAQARTNKKAKAVVPKRIAKPVAPVAPVAPVTETKTYDWSTPAGRKEAVIDAYVEDWNVSLEVATWMVNDNYGEATKELRNDYNEEYREYQRDENVDEFYEAFWPELTTLIGEPIDVPVAKPKTKTRGQKLKKGEVDAIQESSPAPVVDEKQAGASKAVRSGDTARKTAGEKLKAKGKAQARKSRTPRAAVAPTEADKAEPVKPAEPEQVVRKKQSAARVSEDTGTDLGKEATLERSLEGLAASAVSHEDRVQAVEELLVVALFEPRGKSAEEKGIDTVAEMTVTGPALWAPERVASTLTALRKVVLYQVTLGGKGGHIQPTFKKHDRLWDLLVAKDKEGVAPGVVADTLMMLEVERKVIPTGAYNTDLTRVQEHVAGEVASAETTRKVLEQVDQDILDKHIEVLDVEDSAGVAEDFDSVDNVDDLGVDIPGRGGASKIFDLNGRTITKPLSFGAVKLTVGRTMMKFNEKVRPLATTVKNLSDFKRRYPALYKEAMTSRTDGSAIPAHASGYAFGNNIIIFSDNVKNQHELAFTLAHEVIGHFGLGSIMPKKDFHALLDDAYHYDAGIRNAADLYMEKTVTFEATGKASPDGMERYEAIEEALADRAARLDTSLLRRIIERIKMFISKFIPFQDDMVRYFLYHSRRYQRTGTTGDVTPQGIYANLKDLEQRYLAGRARGPHNDILDSQAGFTGDPLRGLPQKIVDVLSKFRTVEGAKTNITNLWHRTQTALEMIQTMDNISLRSLGMRKLYNVLISQKQFSQKLKTELADMGEFSSRFNVLGKGPKGKEPGPTDEQKFIASKVMDIINHVKGPQVDDNKIKNAVGLGKRDANGGITVDMENFAKLQAIGAVTVDQINAGLEIPLVGKDGNQVIGKDGKPEMEKLLVVDSNKKPITLSDKTRKGRDGEPVFVDPIWRMVQEQRTMIDHAAVRVYLAKVHGMEEEVNLEVGQLKKDNSALTDGDIGTLREIVGKYFELYEENADKEGSGITWKDESKTRARHFLYNAVRVLDNKASTLKLGDWKDGPTNPVDVESMTDFVPGGSHADVVKPVVDQLAALGKGKQGAGINAVNIQNTIEDMILFQTQVVNAEHFAKGTLMRAFSPLIHEGKFQVRVQAFLVNKKGELSDTPVRLHENLQAKLLYMRTNDETFADRVLKEVAEILEGQTAETIADIDGNPVTVQFVPLKGTHLENPPLAGSVNYDEFASTLVRAGIQVSPKDRETLVELIAASHSTARSNLLKRFVPGADPDTIRAIAQHLERQTHIAGKNRHQHQVARILTQDASIWHGDPDLLDKLQKKFLKVKAESRNAAKIHIAHSDMAEYQHMFIHSHPGRAKPYIKFYKQDGSFVLKNGKAMGNRYRSKAVDIVSGYHRQDGMPDATGDDAFGQMGGIAMSFAAVSDLGGSIAPALVNMVSLESHTIPYLSTFNVRNGYGGGHGMAAAFREVHRAGRNLSLIRSLIMRKDEVGSAKALQDIIDKGKGSLDKFGLTLAEAEMLRDLTAQGVLTPNLFNALTGAAKAGKSSNRVAKLTLAWMMPFAKTEQFNRRVTALASYRLDAARMVVANGNKPITAEQKTELYSRATRAVNFSQGNYDSFNRPAWAQGSVFKYIWMYKQFQLITVQLMRNLAPKERAIFIAFLILLSGLKGVPFADDFADLADTLMQKFKVKWTGVEAEITLLAEAMGVPAALLLRGPVEYISGITVSTRFGQGDLIPGSGLLKAGANPYREIENIFGAVFSAWKDMFTSAALATKYVAESVGLQDDVTSFKDVARTGFGGFSALKGYAEAMIFLSDGAITNDRGQVVAKDLGLKDALFRFTGFQPGAVTNQYAVNRMIAGVREYSKALSTAYKEAYLKEDAAGRRRVVRHVREWNRDARGTPFKLTIDFAKAVKDAKRTSSERTIRSAPTNTKRFGKDILRASGLDSKGIPITE